MRPRSRLVVRWVVACSLASVLLGTGQAWPQFTSFSHDPRNVLEGNWQSCVQPDGTYSERVYDHIVHGQGRFEVHMGPRREFAIFEGVQDQHRSHGDPENLLTPFRVAEGPQARQRWEIPALDLAFTVALGGGSRTDCESWFVLLEPLKKTSR